MKYILYGIGKFKMKINRLISLNTLSLLLFQFVNLSVAQDNNIPIATVQFPPFSYTGENQKLYGVGTEIVNMVFKELNYTTSIVVIPTKRAQIKVAKGEYAGIYMVTKSSQRE